MSSRYNFERFRALYEDTTKIVSDPQDYFSSEEHHKLSHLAEVVFNKVKPKCEIFIGITEGLGEGSELGRPGIERALCFPKRFLNEPSTDALSNELRVMIDGIIRGTFFLGLMCHLFLWVFPTRDDVKRVNMDDLVYNWALEALIADVKMKEYSKDLNELPLRLFESYFNSTIKPALKKQLRLGFWTLGKCHSYFRNLFFSGARLGMQFDLMTK
jgi:hypothetical protein